MSVNTCVSCDRIIPEGRQVCPICEQQESKYGRILQSQNATEEEVRKAYEWLYIDKEKINE